VQGKSLGRSRADARQALELVDQPGQGAGETAQDARRKWRESKGAFRGA
jgi:hypothetical protein